MIMKDLEEVSVYFLLISIEKNIQLPLELL